MPQLLQPVAFVRFTLPLQTFNLLGVAYEQVEDGTEALELVRAGQKFDCIIIDNQMPRCVQRPCLAVAPADIP